MTPITPEWLRKIADEVRENPTRWTQCTLARDSNGNPVDPQNINAVCWCLQGFSVRDDKRQPESFYRWYVDVAQNDSLNSPAEFVSWLREMAAELEVQS